MGDGSVTFVLVQPGKGLHQDLLDQVALVVAPGKVDADNLGDNGIEMADKLLGGSLIALFPALKARVNIDSIVHRPPNLAADCIMQSMFCLEFITYLIA
jgi:hypothetical protein